MFSVRQSGTARFGLVVEPRRIQGCAGVGPFFLVFCEAHRLPLEWLFESRFDGRGDLAGLSREREKRMREIFFSLLW